MAEEAPTLHIAVVADLCPEASSKGSHPIDRQRFDEAMDIIRLALDNETFSFHGKHFDLPPPGIPDRGGTVEELTLVPRPLYPYEIWQAVTSPPTLEYVPRKGWGGVFWLANHEFIKRNWAKFAENYEKEHSAALAPGEKRMLVHNVQIADTHEEAWKQARAGHDEFWKFLGPYGWSKGYMGADGKPAPMGLIPTLEESLEQRIFVVGSADDVAEQIAWYDDQLGLENILLFPAMPGDTFTEVEEQLNRIATDVMPALV